MKLLQLNEVPKGRFIAYRSKEEYWTYTIATCQDLGRLYQVNDYIVNPVTASYAWHEPEFVVYLLDDADIQFVVSKLIDLMSHLTPEGGFKFYRRDIVCRLPHSDLKVLLKIMQDVDLLVLSRVIHDLMSVLRRET